MESLSTRTSVRRMRESEVLGSRIRRQSLHFAAMLPSQSNDSRNQYEETVSSYSQVACAERSASNRNYSCCMIAQGAIVYN